MERRLRSRPEITAAFTDLEAPTMTPSGLRSDTPAIPFRHPAAVEIRNCSATGDAILGLRSWNSAAVQKERDMLFGGKDDQFKRLVTSAREAALKKIRSGYLDLKEAEEGMYESESFWFGRENFFSLHTK